MSKPGAAAARRDVIRCIGDCFAERVAHQGCKASRVAFLERYLQRVVIGAHPILHPLNVAERRVRAIAGRLRAVGILNHRSLVQIPESRQVSALVPHVGDVEDDVGHQLVLRADVELMNDRSLLIRILATTEHGRCERVRIEEAVRVAVAQLERRRGRDRGGPRDRGLQEIVDQIGWIEAQHPFATLSNRVAIKRHRRRRGPPSAYAAV